MKKTARSGCKLNWFLKVTGRRSDGYHDIVTLFQYLPFPSDTVELDFDAAPGIRVRCSREDLPQDLDNLAGKAAAAYARAAGIDPSWHIFIGKNIPSAAGLGGGSADAGTVLRLLEEHYGALGSEKTAALAAGLGADVPFFLDPGLVLAEGIGEKRRRFPDPEKLPDILLVFPGFPVSAKWAYTHLRPEHISPVCEDVPGLAGAVAAGDIAAIARGMHNDLEYALYDKFPLLELLRKELYARGAVKVLVSGSGSTIFALFGDAQSRKNAAGAVKELFTGDPVSRIFELGSDCTYE